MLLLHAMYVVCNVMLLLQKKLFKSHCMEISRVNDAFPEEHF